MSDTRDDTTHGHPADGRDETAVVGVAAAAGRDQYVGVQIGRAETVARAYPSVQYGGELYRTVWPEFTETYANHAKSGPGRYNMPGQSTVYTTPTMADLRAEAANYEGLDGKAVVRSHFQGELLDARNLPRVSQGALTQGYGDGGKMKSLLVTVTGEDPYTLPRAIGDVARERGLDGVAAPANRGNTNVALFPQDPNAPASGPGRLATNLRGLDHVTYASDGSGPGPVSTQPYSNVPDAAPNKFSPLGIKPGSVTPANPGGELQGSSGYAEKVEDDAELHGRAGGARYGAMGAGIVSLAEGAATGHIDGREVAANAAVGATAAQAEGAIARGLGHVLPPRNVAGAVGGAMPEAAARLRPPGFAAGVGASGIVGGVLGGAVATWNDADEVKSGRMTAGAATANVVAQTGIGMGAGMAGAATGAVFGSFIPVPVAGTAVGAVAGFAVGMGAGYLAEHSAKLHEGERAFGDVLTRHAEPALQHAWRGIATGVDAVRSTEALAEQAVKNGLLRAEPGAAAAGHVLGDAVTNRIESAPRDPWRATAEAGAARTAVEHVATEGLQRAEAGSAAGHAVGDATADPWSSLAALGRRIREGTEQHAAAPRANDHAQATRTLAAGR